MTQDSKATVADFLSAAAAMGRFLKGCSEMPLFTRQFMFLHCIVLFVLDREPAGLPLRILCRQVGLPMVQAEGLIAELREAGAVSMKDDLVAITTEGRLRLAEVERQLVPYVEGEADKTVQLQGLSQQILAASRIWARRPPGGQVSSPGQSPPRSTFARAVAGVRGFFAR